LLNWYDENRSIIYHSESNYFTYQTLFMESHMQLNHYPRLIWMLVLSFIAMYVLMYAMVDTFSNVLPNANQLYMAGLMTCPMLIIELAVMGGMYKNKKLNILLMGSGIVLLIFFFLLIRSQTGVGDRQFLKSMIPHHGGALLMCEQASIKNPEIKALCKSIMIGQQREIDQMKAMLESKEDTPEEDD